MATAPDPFVGTWNLNRDRSEFSPHHQPKEGTMTLTLSPEGHYLMTAEGVNAKGERVHERPQRMIPDGQPYPVPDFPGLSAVCVRPDARTLRAEVRRDDGSIAGHGVYELSQDGLSLTATNSGFDSQLREFRQQTLWERAESAHWR
jgi:hypothetical protein